MLRSARNSDDPRNDRNARPRTIRLGASKQTNRTSPPAAPAQPAAPQENTPATPARTPVSASSPASVVGIAGGAAAPQLATITAPATPEHTAKRVELILQQLDALPTLSVVAVKLLELTASDESQGKDVISLVSSDPALSAKVLKLCRCSERGRALNVTTVDRAVLLLGFDALRSAVLSVQVFELFDSMESPGGERREHPHTFDRMSFWKHSLAVALICENLAGAAGLCRTVNKADAFVSGLLHDLGVLALHVLLPRSFDRVCQLADAQNVSLDQACRRIIGMDTHTAGRRLAEHWRLPHSLGDVLWLHGQRLESLPDLPHRPQIALVTLADALARAHCPSTAGHGSRGEDTKELARQLGLSQAVIDDLVQALPTELEERAASLGMSNEPDPGALLNSIGRANEALGRINAGMRQRALLAQRQTETLRAITQFHDTASPGGTVVTVMGKVVESAAGVFGGGFFAMLYQVRINDPWQLIQFAIDGRPIRSQLILPPPGSTAVSDLADNMQVSMQVMGMLPWLCDYLGDAGDIRDVQLLPLRCGWGVNAVLLHDCPIDGREAREQLEALGRTWAAAIAAGAQHEGAKRLGEQLAEANRSLVEMQNELARSQALAALGEIAAGAAHEMNNPLTVISGRSQLLASKLTEPNFKLMAQQICDQSHRISDMITALRMFAEPTKPQIRATNFVMLLNQVVDDTRGRYKDAPRIKVVVEQALPPVAVDGEQIGRAIAELLRNAIESEGCTHIELCVQIEPVDDRLKVQVIDDGSGLTQHALSHAFDPFFSAKPAGRQPGLGLAHARRLVEAHGGQIMLENGPHKGAIATIKLERWRGQAQHQRDVA